MRTDSVYASIESQSTYRVITPSRPPREPGRLVTCLLLLSTALILVVFAQTISVPRSSPEFQGADESINLGLRFYAAINELLRTGDPLTLEGIVAPGFAGWEAATRASSDRDDLIADLLELRITAPRLTIQVDQVTPAGRGLIDVRLRITGDDQTFLGMTTPSEARSWNLGPSERLRIEAGTVGERWAGRAALASLESLAEVSLPSSNLEFPRVFGLTRVVVAPETTLTVRNNAANRIVLVESGAVALTQLAVVNGGTVGDASTGSGGSATPGSSPAREPALREGTLVSTLPGQAFTVANDAPEPASLLLVTRYGFRSETVTTGDAAEVASKDLDAIRETITAGSRLELLGVGIMPVGPERVVRLGRIALAQGGTLTWPGHPTARLITCEVGVVTVSTTTASIHHGEPIASLDNPRTAPLVAGASITVMPGDPTTWLAVDDAMVLLLVMGTNEAADATPVSS